MSGLVFATTVTGKWGPTMSPAMNTTFWPSDLLCFTVRPHAPTQRNSVVVLTGTCVLRSKVKGSKSWHGGSYIGSLPRTGLLDSDGGRFLQFADFSGDELEEL